MLIWKNKISTWKLEFWTDQKIRLNDKSSNLEPYFLPGPDELSLHRLKNLKVDQQKLWLVHDFYSKEAVLEKDRPFYPRICTLFVLLSSLAAGLLKPLLLNMLRGKLPELKPSSGLQFCIEPIQ